MSSNAAPAASSSAASSIGTRSKRTKDPPVTTTAATATAAAAVAAAPAAPQSKRARLASNTTTTPPTEEESTAAGATTTTTATTPAPSPADTSAPLLASTAATTPAVSTATSSLDPTDPAHFNTFLFELLLFRAQAGNYHVAKETHPHLHAWMQVLKKEYKQHTAIGASASTATSAAATSKDPTSASPSKLTTDQVKVLEYLHVPLTSRGEDHWKRFYELLVQYKERHGHVLVPRLCEIPGLGDWVTDQRRQYKSWKQGQSSQMTPARRELLESIGFQWQVRNRPEWEHRYQELTEYKVKHGDCKVPQHYKENKALGKWVAKQREQYKLMKKGQHTFLTPYRLEKLNALGFSWQVRTSFDGTDEVDAPGGTGKDSASTGDAATNSKVKMEEASETPNFPWEQDAAKEADTNSDGGKKTKTEEPDSKSSNKEAATTKSDNNDNKSLHEEDTEKPSLAAQV